MSNVLWVLQAALLVVAIIILIITFIKAKRTKSLQIDILDKCRDEISRVPWKRVFVSDEEHFKKLRKLLPFQGRGVLLNYPDCVKIKVASLKNGALIERSFAKQELCLEWVGNPSLASSNLHWIGLGCGEDRLMVCADTGFNAINSREETADICRMIDRDFVLPKTALRDFALESNPASLSVVVLFFSLLAFALVDGAILNEYKLINKDVILWMSTPLMITGVPCYFVLAKNRVPSRESYMLSFLLTISLVISFMPIIKRLDQLLAGSELVSYEYKLTGEAKFEPINGEAPKLSFISYKEYWSQFNKDSVHGFRLIRGPLGLWQLDESELKKSYRAYYEKADKS